MGAIMAALLEISQFTEFIVGNKCDLVNVILKQYLDKELHGDDKCFDVVTELDHGCWMLFAAALLSLIVGQTLTQVCRRLLSMPPALEPSADVEEGEPVNANGSC
eukprot:NODE_6593_length_500_cov_44.962306_g5809_i0.p1 GENE.NODE_6593_length_500_cov_44.962306_g5809_i0~~NODE_6593_length_500_cov_44.962306_g5809_i0.p1  ORF type:complete len:112 (+),score=49.71 NODE_6593_length_500_cov_44.962306_g5809_i0:23-337(+)